MLDQLAEDVRGLIDSGAPPITLDEVESPQHSYPRLQRQRRTWITASVAAAVVIVGVIGGLILVGGGNESRSVATFASAGVDCPPSPDSTLQVFLNVQATPAQIEATRVGLKKIPGVTIDRYLDNNGTSSGTWAQAECLLANRQDVLNALSPEVLPVSFAIKSATADSTLIARIKTLPGVDSVVTPELWQRSVTEQRLPSPEAFGTPTAP
jgi:hypothetical protein